jgi:hypothetical protein
MEKNGKKIKDEFSFKETIWSKLFTNHFN